MGSKGALAMTTTQKSGDRHSIQKNEITRQSYVKLREIFLKVLNLPTSEQSIMLERVCKEDSELLNQVKELLAMDNIISDHEKC